MSRNRSIRASESGAEGHDSPGQLDVVGRFPQWVRRAQRGSFLPEAATIFLCAILMNPNVPACTLPYRTMGVALNSPARFLNGRRLPPGTRQTLTARWFFVRPNGAGSLLAGLLPIYSRPRRPITVIGPRPEPVISLPPELFPSRRPGNEKANPAACPAAACRTAAPTPNRPVTEAIQSTGVPTARHPRQV